MDQGLPAYLYRPYIDLGPYAVGPLHVQRVELAYAELDSGAPDPIGLQRVLPPSFRESLLVEAGAESHRVDDPRDLPSEWRTPRWARLADLVGQFGTLDDTTRVNVGRLLVALCLYRCLVDLVPDASAVAVASSVATAKLAYMRATARYVLHLDYGEPYDVGEFQLLAEHAADGSRVKINSLLHLVVQSARDARDVESVEAWAEVALAEIESARDRFPRFDHELLLSRYYRAASFAPQLRGDRQNVIAAMDLAEAYARRLGSTDAFEGIVAAENLHPLLESRTKEALWLGDLDLADARARELTALDPLDPKPLIELAEVHVERGKLREAAEAYRAGARVGPPGTALAWFMAGQCHESLDELELAVDCYLASLRVDPQGISALERLARLSRRLGNRAIGGWAQLRLERLDAPLTPLDGAEPVGVPI